VLVPLLDVTPHALEVLGLSVLDREASLTLTAACPYRSAADWGGSRRDRAEAVVRARASASRRDGFQTESVSRPQAERDAVYLGGFVGPQRA